MSSFEHLLQLVGLGTKQVSRCEGTVSLGDLEVFPQIFKLPTKDIVVLGELFLDQTSLHLIFFDFLLHSFDFFFEFLVQLVDALGLLNEFSVLFSRTILSIALFGFDYGLELLLGGINSQFSFELGEALLMQAAEGVDLRLQNHVHLRYLLEELLPVHKCLEFVGLRDIYVEGVVKPHEPLNVLQGLCHLMEGLLRRP